MNDWQLVNRKIVAKAIAELSYEQILKPDERGALRLASGVSYSFQSWTTTWDFLRIDETTLLRSPHREIAADQFYLDIRSELNVSDITFANFLEELHRTLYSDLQTLERQRNYQDQTWLDLDEGVLQSLLDGHPKALVNKGRIGWSTSDLEQYSPESGSTFKLHWLAVQKDHIELSLAPDLDVQALLQMTMTTNSLSEFQRSIGEDIFKDFHLIPVHPWQWNEVIPFHYQRELRDGSIRYLGVHGDFYRPQTSLRTLSNAEDVSKLQIKLPVSILNTSCVRGIEGKYILLAPTLTKIMKDLCSSDPRLSRVQVLGDEAGAFVKHPTFHTIDEAPYRYKEFLGAVWRESPGGFVKSDEKCLLTAALFHKGFLASIIARSDLSTEAWLTRYFEIIVLPLYHLQLKYGVGLVAHGQNIMIGLKGFQPDKLYLKDFQGDLRLLNQDLPEMMAFDEKTKAQLTRLPAPYLIHDLYTGHFVTVLRFVSATLQEDTGFSEKQFYRLLNQTIQDYHAKIPEYQDRIKALGLLQKYVPRVIVNKVRFHIGYGDNALRPIPMTGTDLLNPLYEGSHDS
ncbi:MAG: siderophore biosynthesis protein IucC [Proteobacteria bacterium]|nr:MAG: siderophore biosynthesis protein IucC [Pseudomonadota bacterium]